MLMFDDTRNTMETLLLSSDAVFFIIGFNQGYTSMLIQYIIALYLFPKSFKLKVLVK